ncbi:hypothetical protein [Corynebacterium spheniscorum]|uniref:Fido domain-containing protein n=1 Tax=Corynebacterium spheniscorum TaxID=185761 RepID=A0A1I2U7X3_9CORY|nr:hypothetical protein [Corynebacterium spheniscorum]KAA8722319.1 hypothetical protein F4V56_05095 [Corynebacterium spheniscorum]SFG71777.1 hypothetical protein SAMN05660282_01732 [Corynebacterium spheniscorum]
MASPQQLALWEFLRAQREIAAREAEAKEALRAVHRRPINLRRHEVTTAASALRGAKLSALLEGDDASRHTTSYSLLTEEKLQGVARNFLRAPAQVCAQLDVLCGGEGKARHPERIHGLARLAGDVEGQVLYPQIVHGEVLGRKIFGPRSGQVARVAARLAAVASGFDPRGLAVPEVYLHRHARRYAEVMGAWEDGPAAAVEFLLEAWIAGAAEAESIAAEAAGA